MYIHIFIKFTRFRLGCMHNISIQLKHNIGLCGCAFNFICKPYYYFSKCLALYHIIVHVPFLCSHDILAAWGDEWTEHYVQKVLCLCCDQHMTVKNPLMLPTFILSLLKNIWLEVSIMHLVRYSRSSAAFSTSVTFDF